MNKQQKSKYTHEWVPIKNIVNGMIQLDNGENVTGIKILPRNIFILDQDAQYRVLNSLKVFYNMIDFEFWVMAADRPVDISLYLSQLQLLFNNTNSGAVRKLIMQDINKANSFTQNNVVDTEYYLLFKEKNQEVIQKRLRTIISGLAGAGLNSMQVTNSDLRTLVDNFLNGGKTFDFGTVVS